jgi:hypothetical protein
MIQLVRFWLILFSFIFHEFLFWFLFNHGKVFFIGFRWWTDSIVLFFTSFSSEEEVFGLVFNLSWRVVVFFHGFSLGLSFKLAIYDSLFQDFLVFTALVIFRIDIIFCRLGFHESCVIGSGPFKILILSLLMEALQNWIIDEVLQVLEINLFWYFGLENALPPIHIDMFWLHGDGPRLGLRCVYFVRFFIWKGIGLHNYD